MLANNQDINTVSGGGWSAAAHLWEAAAT